MNLLNMFLNLLSATPVENKTPDLFFEPGNFIKMLSYMGKGMLVIFVIISVIIIATILTNKFFSKK